MAIPKKEQNKQKAIRSHYITSLFRYRANKSDKSEETWKKKNIKEQNQIRSLESLLLGRWRHSFHTLAHVDEYIYYDKTVRHHRLLWYRDFASLWHTHTVILLSCPPVVVIVDIKDIIRHCISWRSTTQWWLVENCEWLCRSSNLMHQQIRSSAAISREHSKTKSVQVPTVWQSV